MEDSLSLSLLLLCGPKVIVKHVTSSLSLKLVVLRRSYNLISASRIILLTTLDLSISVEKDPDVKTHEFSFIAFIINMVELNRVM